MIKRMILSSFWFPLIKIFHPFKLGIGMISVIDCAMISVIDCAMISVIDCAMISTNCSVAVATPTILQTFEFRTLCCILMFDGSQGQPPPCASTIGV